MHPSEKRKQRIGERKAFVLMPFSQPFDSYYSAIFRPALEACGFTVTRADDIYTPRPVMLDIQESILAADLVLCELSGRNPNVFYELGLAHAAGKPTILVSTKEEDVPFDLRHIRVIHYETRMAGWETALRQAIEKSALAVTSSANVWPPALSSVRAPDQGRGRTVPSNPQITDCLVDRPLNLSFDGAVEKGFPHGWFDSFGYVGNVSTDYVVKVVPRDDSLGGLCLMLSKTGAKRNEFGSVMQRFPAEFLAGRTVRLEGEIKTKGVKEWTGLWLRGDDESTDVFFDNMSSLRVRGDTGWTRYSVEGKLPSNVSWLNLGVVLSGDGVVWADRLRLLCWTNDGEWIDV